MFIKLSTEMGEYLCIKEIDNLAREVVSYYVHNSLHSLPCSALNSLEISDYTWYTVNLNNSDIILLVG